MSYFLGFTKKKNLFLGGVLNDKSLFGCFTKAAFLFFFFLYDEVNNLLFKTFESFSIRLHILFVFSKFALLQPDSEKQISSLAFH